MIFVFIRKLFLLLPFLLLLNTAASADTKQCLDLLATNLADTILSGTNSDDTIIMGSDMFVEFFAKNIDVCRDYLLSRTEEHNININTPELILDVDWDYLINEIASATTVDNGQRTLFVCENNRSIQAGIDVGMWGATIVAAVFSWGSGGVAIQGAKAGITQGAKSLVRAGVGKGMKTAAIEATAKRLGYDIAGKEAAKLVAEQAVKEAGKNSAKAVAAQAAKDAAKAASRTMANNAAIVQARASLQSQGKKRITDAMLKKEIQAAMTRTPVGSATANDLTAALSLIDDKIAKNAAAKTAAQAAKAEVAAATADLAAATAALTAERAAASTALKTAMAKFAISTPLAAAGGIASVYSFLESGFSPNVMNCTNTDAGEGCYLSCTKDSLASPSDDLNTKVFKPIFGKNLCIDEENNYVLREISTGLPMAGDVFITTEAKWQQARSAIISKVKDTGNCDWNEDDIDMYIGTPLYDSSTLMPTNSGATGLIIDGIRIDE